MADKGTKEPKDDRSKVGYILNMTINNYLWSHNAHWLYFLHIVQRQAWLESLSPQQLEVLRSYAWDKLLRTRKVKVDGKVRE